MKKIKRFLIPFVDILFRAYWFTFRPHTYGALAVIQNPKKELLMIRQSYGSGSWKLSGGAIEKGESPENAVIREVKEELGITIEHPILLFELLSTRQYKRDHVSVLLVRVDHVTPRIDDVEVIDARWFPLEALPTPYSALSREILHKVFPELQ